MTFSEVVKRDLQVFGDRVRSCTTNNQDEFWSLLTWRFFSGFFPGPLLKHHADFHGRLEIKARNEKAAALVQSKTSFRES